MLVQQTLIDAAYDVDGQRDARSLFQERLVVEGDADSDGDWVFKRPRDGRVIMQVKVADLYQLVTGEVA